MWPNPFNGIESHCMHVQTPCTVLGRLNPFNGIESVVRLSKIRPFLLSLNPFNGIESKVELEVSDMTSREMNPFNGIERIEPLSP